jgi:hypothetical protein
MAMGSGCQLDGNADSVKSSARPNNKWFINTRLMSSELRQQEAGTISSNPRTRTATPPIAADDASFVLVEADGLSGSARTCSGAC